MRLYNNHARNPTGSLSPPHPSCRIRSLRVATFEQLRREECIHGDDAAEELEEDLRPDLLAEDAAADVGRDARNRALPRRLGAKPADPEATEEEENGVETVVLPGEPLRSRASGRSSPGINLRQPERAAASRRRYASISNRTG